MPIRVVTDSTAYLPDELAAAAQLEVVPLAVILAGEEGREGLEVSPADVARVLGERRMAVTTSRPSPAEFSRVYRRLFDQGATGIVSVHISGKLSGTAESAALAAAEFGDRVVVVDAATAGMAVGFVALCAESVARGGAGLEQVRVAAADAAERTATFFYVNTLEFLRRGGRISAASALVGTALSVKPILAVTDGSVVLAEKVRTAARGMSRLAELAVEAAGESDVDVAIQHLAAPERASELRQELTARLGARIKGLYTIELGAVLAAHTGPGVVGVAVHRRID